MKFEKYFYEDEMKAIAYEQTKNICERSERGADITRPATEEEHRELAELVYGAMWTLQRHQNLSTLQAIQDFAEVVLGLRYPNINSYNSFFLTFDNIFDEWRMFVPINTLLDKELKNEDSNINDVGCSTYCLDEDLEEFFRKNHISYEVCNEKRQMNFNGSYEPVGYKYGDYLYTCKLTMTRLTKTVSYVPVYAVYNGFGVDEGLCFDKESPFLIPFDDVHKEFAKEYASLNEALEDEQEV